MKTKEIEIISEIVNFQRFSDAADSLSYSHSVISKYVTNVENELGIKLFVRGNKASELALTPEGKLIVPAIQRVNDDYQYMLELVKQLRNDSENILRVGTTTRFGNVIEQEALVSFMCGCPNVKLEQATMTTKGLLKLLKANRLDAAFIVCPDNMDVFKYIKSQIDDDDIEVRFIKNESNLFVAVADNFYHSEADEAPLSDFRDFTFAFPIIQDRDDCAILNTAAAHAAETGFELKTMFSNVYGSTVFRLAQKSPIAFLSTNVENLYNWIRFVRISDWKRSFNVYFLTQKSNKKKSLQSLKRCCTRFSKEPGPEHI